MSTWTNKDIERARAAIAAAPTLTAGYAAAATALSRTPTAIRIARERGTLGDVEPKAVTLASAIAGLKEKSDAAALRRRVDELLETVANRDAELALFKAVARDPKPIPVRSTKGKNPKQRQGVAVFLWSDWHVEETVDPATINGLNEYNLSIARRRIRRLVEACAWLLNDARFDIREAIIGLIGDLISGYIHEELVESNSLSPQAAIVWLLDELEAALRLLGQLCPNVERFIVVCKSGNHGRSTPKIRVSTREANSNEAVLYQTLARVMRDDPRFEFVIVPGEWTEVLALDYPLMFTHGDSFNYGGGVGGITIPIRRGIARQFSGAVGSNGKPFHAFNMGHFHQRQVNGEIHVNGSLIGYGPYSQRVHAKYEPPMQHFYIVDSVYGASVSAPVWVEKDKDLKRGALVPTPPGSLASVKAVAA